MEPYTDLSLKKLIDAGRTPGTKLDVTGPYIGDYSGLAPQTHGLSGAGDSARMVDYWADEGETSFKAYTSIKSDDLKAAIEHAHANSIRVINRTSAPRRKQQNTCQTTWIP